MICYAMIDINVLVSALLSSHGNAATVQVVEKLLSGEVIPLLSKEILREYAEVLRRKKLGFLEEAVSSLIYVIEKYGEMPAPTPTDEILPDMKDLPSYEIVLEKDEEEAYLVAGNLKHFPIKPFIVTAREFLDILDGSR